MKAIKLLVIMLTICQLTFGQENVKSSIIDPFQKEALFREKVYLQLNKAIYFSNENIWFKAYVSDDAFNALSIYTSNLTVNLLDLNGNVVDSKEIFIKDGVGVGEFQIKEKYANGKYFVNAYTNYMQNFGEENIFIQDLNILKLNVSEKEPNKENQYEIQLFPESGYLLEDAKNSIGIKSLVNGKGVSFSGHIVNSKNEKVVDFHGNKFGMSKASFNYEKGEEYTSIIDVNGTTQKTALPIANTNGVIFSVDNNDEDILKVTLSTNEESLENLKTDELSIIIYRNSFICDAVTLKLNSNESIEQEVLFYKDKMLYGVNTITLFRNNQPIAERKVFINKPVENTSVLIDKLDESRDSTSYRVSTINSDFNPISTKMSVSVLSAESQIVLESQNIKTAYLLSPYVKGFIEKPSYYFNQETGNELKDLDLLLINQSWSAYSLNDKIAEVNPEQTFEFENGFNLNGFAKKAPNGYDIALLNKKNKIASTTTIDNKDYFNLTNIFAYKHDSIKFTYIKKNKPLISPKNINLSSPRLSKQNFSSLISNYNYSDPLNDDSIEKLNLDSSTLDMTSTEKLREVVLSNVKSERKENNFDREMNIASKRNEIASEFYVNKKVTERIEMENKSALDYLGSLGLSLIHI